MDTVYTYTFFINLYFNVFFFFLQSNCCYIEIWGMGDRLQKFATPCSTATLTSFILRFSQGTF